MVYPSAGDEIFFIDFGYTAIIYHAGGFVKWSKDVVPKSEISTLTDLGFVVLVPNYRLCPQISVFNGPIADSRDCLVWAANELPGLLQNESVEVDRNRIVAMGHSAGGTLALLMVRPIYETCRGRATLSNRVIGVCTGSPSQSGS